MNRLLIIMITIGIGACTKADQDKLKDYIEYGLESREFVRWTKEQPITWDHFTAAPNGRGIYYNYYGIYFFWTKDSVLQFNATVYFDKGKSWVKPKSEWGDADIIYDQVPKLLKLKFDYYEYVARQLRKQLSETGHNLNEEDMRPLIQTYYDKAENEWKAIQDDLNCDYSDSKLEPIRLMIDMRLEELKDFDSSINSVFK